MSDIRARLSRLEGFVATQSKAAQGSPGSYAFLMGCGAADGYRLALADASEWLRSRGNHGAAAALDKLWASPTPLAAGENAEGER
jgi:hypothetical protein